MSHRYHSQSNGPGGKGEERKEEKKGKKLLVKRGMQRLILLTAWSLTSMSCAVVQVNSPIISELVSSSLS